MESRVTEDEPQPHRVLARHATTLFVWYVQLSVAADHPKGHLAHTADISGSGLGIRSTVELPVGELLFLELTGSLGNVSAVGRVVHCSLIDGTHYRVGVRFEVVPPNDRPILERLAKP